MDGQPQQNQTLWECTNRFGLQVPARCRFLLQPHLNHPDVGHHLHKAFILASRNSSWSRPNCLPAVPSPSCGSSSECEVSPVQLNHKHGLGGAHCFLHFSPTRLCPQPSRRWRRGWFEVNRLAIGVHIIGVVPLRAAEVLQGHL